MPKSVPRVLLLVILIFAFVPALAALEWGPVGGPDYYDPARHNPFARDPAFIAPTLDLSGVGQYHLFNLPLHDNHFWVTMISDTYFITAAHTSPNLYPDQQMTFYHDHIPVVAESIALDYAYHGMVFGADFWVGRLKSAPSSAVKRYPLIKRPEGTNYAGIDGIDSKLYLIGVRGATLEYGPAQSRVGLNDISHHYGGHLYFTYDFAQRGVDEVRTLCCDSSGPSFVDNHYGNFALAGLHHDNRDGNISAFAAAIAAEVYSASNGLESVTIVSDLAGDLNADFKVDLADRDILLSNLGNGPNMRYIQGDVDGDGYVNNVDLLALEANFNKTLSAPADFNADFAVNKLDMLAIGTHWHSAVTPHTDGDANGDGYVDVVDFDLLNAGFLYVPWTAPVPVSPIPGDLTKDGLVDSDDSTILLSCITSTCTPQDFARADINIDGFVNSEDLQIMVTNWDPHGPADVNNDLKINNADIAVLFNNWASATNMGKAGGDLNLDGVVNMDDYVIMTAWWGRGVSDFAAQPPLAYTPLPGDFNADGTVDAADYVLWRKNPDAFPLDAYTIWRSHFGAPTDGGAGSGAASAVPEPSTLLLCLISIAVVAARRQRPTIFFSVA